MTEQPGVSPDDPKFVYDEFALFAENCEEFGLPESSVGAVARVSVRTDDVEMSALRWGKGPVELVFLHGSAQNAHTWDTVVIGCNAIAARRGDKPISALCVDLPGHGHSGWRDDAVYDPRSNAEVIAELLVALDVGRVPIVGMSLGGLTLNALAARHHELVDRALVVDITPGVNSDKAAMIHKFIAGPQEFASFDEILKRTIEFNPGRSKSSLRRGILHNARRLPGGGWRWRYDRRQLANFEHRAPVDLWDDISAIAVPYLLARGAESPVVDADDVAELRRRLPAARVELIDGAGHSIQGDRPLELCSLIIDWLE